jgi:hypothetical protein
VSRRIFVVVKQKERIALQLCIAIKKNYNNKINYRIGAQVAVRGVVVREGLPRGNQSVSQVTGFVLGANYTTGTRLHWSRLEKKTRLWYLRPVAAFLRDVHDVGPGRSHDYCEQTAPQFCIEMCL